MGTSYRSGIFVGLQFDDYEEAKDFAISNLELTDEQFALVEEEGLSEYFDLISKHIQATPTNFYDWDCGWFIIGINIASAVLDPKTFLSTYNNALAQWSKVFPKQEPRIFNTVIVS